MTPSGLLSLFPATWPGANSMEITPYVTAVCILLMFYEAWDLWRIDKRNGPNDP